VSQNGNMLWNFHGFNMVAVLTTKSMKIPCVQYTTYIQHSIPHALHYTTHISIHLAVYLLDNLFDKLFKCLKHHMIIVSYYHTIHSMHSHLRSKEFQRMLNNREPSKCTLVYTEMTSAHWDAFQESGCISKEQATFTGYALRIFCWFYKVHWLWQYSCDDNYKMKCY